VKRATSLKEIKQVFRYNDQYLAQEDENFYENLYATSLKKLEMDIEDSEIYYDTFYITGQSGNGKSTAINHLKNTSNYIKTNYNVKHLFANDVFDFSDDLTIVDVLLMIGLSLVESDDKLKTDYLDKLQKLKDFHVGKLEESILEENETKSKSSFSTYAKGEIGFLSMFKFGANLREDYLANENNRTLLRRIFLPNRKELLEIINEIINEYNLKDDKKLLLILDDLEKKNVDKELFTRHIELLEKIEVLKIVMIPVNYATRGNVYKLNLRLKQNPITKTGEKSPNEHITNNITLLKNLIYRRIDDRHKDLLPDTKEVVEKIIEYSGGNIRQLLMLIVKASNASRLNDGKSISQKDVDEAIQEMLNMIAIGVSSKISFLKYVDKYHIPDENEPNKFIESISDNTIYAYFNGTPWYEVNPIIKQYIKDIKIS